MEGSQSNLHVRGGIRRDAGALAQWRSFVIKQLWKKFFRHGYRRNEFLQESGHNPAGNPLTLTPTSALWASTVPITRSNPDSTLAPSAGEVMATCRGVDLVKVEEADAGLFARSKTVTVTA